MFQYRHKTRLSTFAILFFFCLCCSSAHPLQPEPNALFVRVIDNGPALCTAIVMPGNHFMIYDAGNYTDGGKECFESIKEVIPEGSDIDLLVLSHTDSDHLAAVDEICDAYHVKRVIRSGFVRDSQTWKKAAAAVLLERETEGCTDINLKDVLFLPGSTFRFGEVFVTMVAGWHNPPAEWGPPFLSLCLKSGVELHYMV